MCIRRLHHLWIEFNDHGRWIPHVYKHSMWQNMQRRTRSQSRMAILRTRRQKRIRPDAMWESSESFITRVVVIGLQSVVHWKILLRDAKDRQMDGVAIDSAQRKVALQRVYAHHDDGTKRGDTENRDRRRPHHSQRHL